MNKVTSPLQTFALTALRVGVGVIMVVHGWLKLIDMQSWYSTVESLGIPYPGVSSWLAVAAELLGGAGLVVGLLTPLAAFGVLFNMVTAIVTVHWGQGLLASNNGFEFPLTLGLVALYFVVRGGGPLSLDAAFSSARRRRAERRRPVPPEPAPRGRRMQPAEAAG